MCDLLMPFFIKLFYLKIRIGIGISRDFHLHSEKLFVRYLVTVLRLAMQYSVLEL